MSEINSNITSLIDDLQARVDSVIVAIQSRLVTSMTGESVEMAPTTLRVLIALLEHQGNIIEQLMLINQIRERKDSDDGSGPIR